MDSTLRLYQVSGIINSINITTVVKAKNRYSAVMLVLEQFGLSNMQDVTGTKSGYSVFVQEINPPKTYKVFEFNFVFTNEIS